MEDKKLNTIEKHWTDNSLKLFMISVTVLSLIVETVLILTGIGILTLLMMWTPAICAFIANIVSLKEKKEKITFRNLFGDLGFRSSKLVYLLLGVIIPFIYLLIPYMIYWNRYPENFAYNGVALSLIIKDCGPVMIVGTVMGLLSATGEEIGWRGYMVPAFLERIGLIKTLLFTSLYWVCWHLPILIFGGYMAETPLWYRIPAFMLCIIPIGIIAGLLAYKSKSVWPSALLHAAHNNYDQSIFSVISRGEKLMFYASETGIFTIIFAWIFAVIMLVYTLKTEKETD